MDIKTDFMNEISENWKMSPYTNIVLTSALSCPPDHPKAVF
jgi:hypothetical protein